jgi:WD40 repeat protein
VLYPVAPGGQIRAELSAPEQRTFDATLSVLASTKATSVAPLEEVFTAGFLKRHPREAIADKARAMAWQETPEPWAITRAGNAIHGVLVDRHQVPWRIDLEFAGAPGKPRVAGLKLEELQPDPLASVAISPDERLVAAGSLKGKLWLWDLSARDTPAKVLSGMRGKVNNLAFSPDSRFLLASARRTGEVGLWEVERSRVGQVVTPLEKGQSVTFSADGELMTAVWARGEKGTVLVWKGRDLAAPPLLELSADAALYNVAVSPDRRWLAAAQTGNPGQLTVWDLTRPNDPPRALTGHRRTPFACVFSADGDRLYSAGFDGTLRSWDVRNDFVLSETFKGHDGRVMDVAATRDGKHVVTVGSDGTLRRWPALETLIPELCQRVWRNFTAQEWSELMGATIPYETTCPNLGPAD